MKPTGSEEANLNLSRQGGVLLAAFSGRWVLRVGRPGVEVFTTALGEGCPESVRFLADGLQSWDSSLLNYVRHAVAAAEERGLACNLEDLPAGVRRLLALSKPAPEENGEEEPYTPGRFEFLGLWAERLYGSWSRALDFIGQTALDLAAFLRGGVALRRRDFLAIVQACGAQALPIVSLLSFLTGLIVAFIGVIQLQKFAADIYVADLVGLAMTRELGAVMTGVILAGRTGAAFAAELGSMRVNEEIDALHLFGLPPGRFLVLPRVLALVLMAPLLCAFAVLVAILGGLVVAAGISDVSVLQYCNQVDFAVTLADFWLGILKSAVFGLIIALTGCYCGLTSGRDASAVGRAATSAVVISITWIVVTDAVFAVLCHIVGI